MKKTCKKLVSVLLAAIMVCSLFTIVPFSVGAADEAAEQVGGVQDSLNTILSVYPTGSYFTASGNVCYSNQSSDCRLSNIPSRGGLPSGSSVAAVTGDAWSCCSFARYVFYCMFGVSPESCGTVSSSNAQIGDYMNLGTHYAIYLGQDSTYWYVYDSNYTSPASNIVKYNRALRKSNFSSVKIHHAPNYNNNPNLPESVDLGTDFYAYIEHQSTGMYLTNQSTNVAGEIPNGTSNQIWKFIRQSNGAYAIQSTLNGYYMDVYGVYDEDNTNVYTWPEYTGGSNQQFYIYYQYDAYYFRPAHSYTRRLDMSSTDDHNLSIWGSGEDWSPQEFNIIKIDSYGSLPVDIGTNFYAYIEHQSTGMYLTNQNTNIAGEMPNGSSNQIWKFVRQSNGAYAIQSTLNGYYMDVYGVYDEDNTNVYTWPEYTGGSNQQFYIYYQYDAYYFRPAHSYTRRLDMSSTDDHNLSIWGSGEDWFPQEFNIIKIDSYGSLPVDIGTNFYAYIEHQSTGLYLTNQNTNVAGEIPNGTSNQIWKFIRQSNGAYAIQSTLNGYYMDVYGVYDEDNTNVYTWPEYTGGSNQQFYIYYQYDAYYFRPAHSYTRRLDMSSIDDHNLSIWGSGEDWSPQEFEIKKISENDIGVHKFVDTIVPPTINSEGYTEHTCSVCGYSYKDTYTYLYDIESLDLNITLSNNSYTYDGTAKTPNVIVSNDNETLTKDTDYTVEYSNNINTGTATVTVTGIGNYTGVLTKTFTITNAIGDVDGDGIISVSDATALQKQLANGVEFDDEMLAVADTNGDGIVSVSDATLIQKYLAGNASSLG